MARDGAAGVLGRLGFVVVQGGEEVGEREFETGSLGRQFAGIELKPICYRTAVGNLRNADAIRDQRSLFSWSDAPSPEVIKAAAP